ncbi:hypothetical protein MHAE_08483 [Mycobacterium haemophilum DSM 44634]|uniref:hypothetical protein n=1 Tax=Mycobacterium haemophilum TaxID=29311 RepID=UPI000654E3D1|nr:hypothetical protein [Mycobacterium haemophilum]AKN15687.1 hypothetical protein B586_02505 [Mycobacterium haemophilum DSM 44634]MCV7341228.1 hypothetical protein [Mycobacterium haemophilum DSM 44634]
MEKPAASAAGEDLGGAHGSVCQQFGKPAVDVVRVVILGAGQQIAGVPRGVAEPFDRADLGGPVGAGCTLRRPRAG